MLHPILIVQVVDVEAVVLGWRRIRALGLLGGAKLWLDTLREIWEKDAKISVEI